MKKRLNITLLVLWLVSTAVSIVNWITFIDLPSFVLPLIPAFCSQLLLCRVTKSGWLRALPALPVAALLALAGWHAIFGSGWDMLAALIFAFASIAPAVGVGLGWLAWWLMQRKNQNISTEEC